MASKGEEIEDDEEESSDEEYIPNQKELKVFKDDERENRSLLSSESRKRNEIEKGERGEGESEESKKARMDQLWADFKGGADDSLPQQQEETKREKREISKDTVTVKKAYDFAGEEVLVDQEVSVHSKEGQSFIQGNTNGSTERKRDNVGGAKVGGTKVGGAQALLLSLKNKRPKLSTLEKSKLDWDSYKREEGLEEELNFQSKDGYLERQAFLGRVDVRQFEIERNERLKRFKRLH